MDLLKALNFPDTVIDMQLFNHVHVEPSWNFTERTLDEHMIYYVKGGHFKALWQGQENVIESGDVIWLSPGVTHSFSLIEQHQRPTKFNMRFKLKLGMQSLGNVPEVLHLQQAHHLSPLFQNLHSELRLPSEYYQYRLKNILSILLIDLLKGNQNRQTQHRVLSNLQRQQLDHFLDQSDLSRVQIHDLSKVLCYTTDYFSRIFKNTFGMSPKSWLIREKILRSARYLVEYHQSLMEVGERLGYPDSASFSNQFKQVMGLSPNKWRQQHQARK